MEQKVLQIKKGDDIMKQDKRYVIVRNNCEVSVLDTEPEEENLEMLGVECENEEEAMYLAYELEPMVRCLNEQDMELKKMGIIL